MSLEPTPAGAAPSKGDGGVRAIVDLTLGAWRSREAAAQLAASLGITLAPGLGADPGASPMGPGPAAVDAAAVGDPVALLSFDDARRIAAALPPTGMILVLAPCHGQGIGTLNDWLFHFLRRSALQIATIGEEPPTAMARGALAYGGPATAPPPGRPIDDFTEAQQGILRFFPGLLPKAVLAASDIDPADAALVPIGTDRFLIPPAYRDTDPRAAPTMLDAMEPVEALDDGFRALAQSFCTAHFADSAALAALARRAFLDGETELARALAARARAVARTPEHAADADLIGHEVRLYQQRHAEILATPEPSRRALPEQRARLAAMRLHAAIERDDRASALAGLPAVRSRLETGAASREDLDLLARHVAARIRHGAGEAAAVASLAEALETAAEAAGDARLVMAARRNRVALARAVADVPAERRALSRLLAASAGSRTLAEIVAMNVELARIEVDQTSAEARGAWLRAAFAWLAYEPFEAFPAALVEVVLGTASLPRSQIDEAICERLASGIGRGRPTDSAGELLPAVHLRSRHPGAPERVVGSDGIALLWSRQLDWAAPSPFRQRLLGAAWGAFRQSLPAGDLREGTIIVDDDLGNDLPATREAALAQALRLGVADVRFGDEKIAIDPGLRPRLAAGLRIGLSPAVQRVGGSPEAPAIAFSRRFPDIVLSGREAEVVAALGDNGRMPIGTLAVLLGLPLAETEHVLRDLERRHVIRIDMPAKPPAAVSPAPRP